MPSERVLCSSSVGSKPLSIPVVLRERSADSVRVVTLLLASDGTVEDLHNFISSLLGPDHVLSSLRFRGSEPNLASPLQDFAAASIKPHF